MVVYRADDSGPFPPPHAKSNALPHNRIDHITHHRVFRGLTGPGRQPSGLRFAQNLHRRLEELDITEEWSYKGDFSTFFWEVDIFKFDHMFPTFGPGLPRFMMPKSYSFRDGLETQFNTWYEHDRKNYDASQTFADGDGDPWWESTMMRLRQDAILGAENQDDESLARVDLGSAWAIIGNVVSTSMFSAFHVFKDKNLLARVQQEIGEFASADGSLKDTDPHKLGKDATVLLSVYAETLRKYIKVYYSVYSAPHEDVDLGRWVLPRGALAISQLGPLPPRRDLLEPPGTGGTRSTRSGPSASSSTPRTRTAGRSAGRAATSRRRRRSWPVASRSSLRKDAMAPGFLMEFVADP
ncbi:cytochrome p450 domain-containing protein [Apiospora phragmitis]|uniref:Cytochrome p450 domain-containing protein n=1 Tax=Apiospora phragmitis TaxID=2905665 RepID=A0ABR1VDK8_9PEZI